MRDTSVFTANLSFYILDALNHPKYRADKRHTIEELELSEEIFRDGVNFVVDEIETDGAELLGTKYCECEIAFAVTGRDIKSLAIILHDWAII